MERRQKSWARKMRWIFYPLLIGAIVFLVLSQKQEVRKPAGTDYNSRIETEQRYLKAQAGDRVPLRLRIKNRGKKAWSSEGEFPCFLSYHLYLRENYRTVRFDNRRFPLPSVIEPGKAFDMEITLRAPVEAQRYIIMFDMVREGQSWFRDYGSRTAVIAFDVAAKEWPGDKTTIHSSQKESEKLLNIIRLTLHQNEVRFPGRTGRVSGFAAGVDYPQIWLRDANTILHASRYYYDRDFLASWLEEHLAFQKENGSLQDWIDSRGKSDKNTTETDQESSAVQSAFHIHHLLGPRWLEKPVAGVRIIDRLDAALMYVCDSRWNDRLGLVIGAHTADWGDVDLVDNDEKAVYVDDRSHWTADIYDQSMFFGACSNLAKMWDALGEKQRMAFWEEKAKSVGENTNKCLWQEDKGFYKVHTHLDSLQHDFDEEAMFAMGGNVQAVLSGLADPEKSRRIIEQALQRQETYGISTISGTLLPPYPKNFFKHPLMDSPYEYQNGAQWDWFGARLIHAMFQQGLTRKATEKWVEIIEKNMGNRGFFEWDNKDGVGQGSDFYAGSAGSMGQVLFESYLGIKQTWNELSIEPRLGRESAQVHVYQPANERFVAYDYQFDESAGRISLSIESNFPSQGTLKILDPWASPDTEQSPSDDLVVLLDGEEVGFGRESKNQDVFIVIPMDFRKHIIQVSLKNSQ
jgi:hypothetical protein